MLYGLKSTFIPATAKGVWGASGIVAKDYTECQCHRGDTSLLIPWINDVALPGFIQSQEQKSHFTCYLSSGSFHFDAEIRGEYVYMTAYHLEPSHDQIIT